MKKLCAAVCLALVFASCAATAAGDQPASCLMNSERAANPEHSVTYEGTTVGFCCENCKAKFEGLSNEEKTAKIAASMTR